MKISTLTFISSILFFIACGSPLEHSHDDASFKGLADTKKGNNVALILGAPNDLLGVSTDVKEMEKLLKKKTMNFDFEIMSKNFVTADEAISLTKNLVQNADSFLWYFSGHGSRDGLYGEDRKFSFKDILSTIKISRKNKPLKRLVVFLDSCFSGSFINEAGPRPKDESSERDFNSFVEKEVFASLCDSDDPSVSCKGTDLYEQAIIMVSSKANEPSEDLDRKRGGAFTFSLRTSIEKFKKENPKATIKQLADETSSLTKKISGQTPIYKFFPRIAVGQDKLFRYR